MFTALADGWVEVGLTEGKVTVYMNVTQKKNTRIDISSGAFSTLVFRMDLFVILLLPSVIVATFILLDVYRLKYDLPCRFRSE